MPEEFDPDWEYFTRDPEFWGEDEEEVVFEKFYYDDPKDACYSIRRHPNYGKFSLADPRPKADPRTRTYVTYECPVCNNEHTREAGRARVCCSRRCFKELVSRDKLLAPKQVRCEGCRVLFVRKTGDGANTAKQRFCTLACWNRHQRKPLYLEGCPICGERVIRSGKGRSRAKIYCSRPCMKKAVKRRYNYRRDSK